MSTRISFIMHMTTSAARKDRNMQPTVEAMAIDQYRLTQTSALVLLAMEGRKPDVGGYYFPERKQQGGPDKPFCGSSSE